MNLIKQKKDDNPYGFKRKSKEERPVLAICYDFDKTLSPDDMQAQGYIQSVNYHVDRFWAESNEMARANGMDSNLAYMYKMVREAKGHFDLSRKALEEYGSKVELFPGVDEWFERVRQYGDKNGVIIEHYIISSGLKEMIEGTKIAKRGSFEEIYVVDVRYFERNLVNFIKTVGATDVLFTMSAYSVVGDNADNIANLITQDSSSTIVDEQVTKKRKAPTNHKVYAPTAQVLSCGCIRLSKTIYLDRCSSQYKEVNKMQELNYPFDPSYIIKKRKSIKRELLADGSARIKRKSPFLVVLQQTKL